MPVRTDPVPPWPHHDAEEVAAVADILRSGRVNQWTGSEVTAFQDEFAVRHNGRRAVAVANGTLALEIALRALEIGPGDEVIVPARSFVASAACASLVGATPVFADVDLDTQVVNAATIAARISDRTRAVVVVHLNGRPCDMAEIMRLAALHGLLVIEDCAQSVGASIDGWPVGAFGDAAAFSFCQDKIISTGGEGGMILFENDAAWKRAWSFKDNGKSYDRAFDAEPEPGYRWMHESIGTNARMTELQAAIGRIQLTKLDDWVARRNSIANRLQQALRAHAVVTMPGIPDGHVHARYRLEFAVDETRLRDGWNRDRIMLALNAEGIAVNVGTCPEIYRETAYGGGSAYPRLPNAMQLGRTSLILLTHPTIDERYLQDCEVAIEKVFAEASA